MQKYFQYKISQLMGNLLTLKLALFQISDSLYSRNVIKIMLEKKNMCKYMCWWWFSRSLTYIYILQKSHCYFCKITHKTVLTLKIKLNHSLIKISN